MIDHINQFTNLKGGYHFQVYYTSGRMVRYTMNDNLPMSVVDVLCNGDCETYYTSTGKNQ